jgi:hypothetical protein
MSATCEVINWDVISHNQLSQWTIGDLECNKVADTSILPRVISRDGIQSIPLRDYYPKD